jgi:hypothetical protein
MIGCPEAGSFDLPAGFLAATLGLSGANRNGRE